MTQTELPFHATKNGQSQAAKLERIFRDNPNRWLSMTELGQQIGAWAVHSRVADLRRRGMTIENRTKRDNRSNQTISYYMFIP